MTKTEKSALPINNTDSNATDELPFTYDLTSMKIAIESQRIIVPAHALSSDVDFEAWIHDQN